MNNKMLYYKKKFMNSERKDWLSYYKKRNHYLKSVAELFATNINIDFEFCKRLFKESKNINSQRDRKKILKTCYHNFDMQHSFFNNENRMILILQKNNLSPSVFAHYLKKDNFSNYDEIIQDIDQYNKFGEYGFKIHSKKFDIKSYLNYIDKKNEKIKYPSLFDNIDDCLSGFKLSPVKTMNEMLKLSKKYQNCWQATGKFLMKNHDFFLVNIKDVNGDLIGTLRYLTIPDENKKDTLRLSGWVNPDLMNGEKYFEFSQQILKEISQKIYSSSKDKNFNPENIRIELHYNNPKKTVSSLLPWDKTMDNEIENFIKNKTSFQNHSNKKRKNRLF